MIYASWTVIRIPFTPSYVIYPSFHINKHSLIMEDAFGQLMTDGSLTEKEIAVVSFFGNLMTF